jgi:hypothetical protein
MTLRIYLLLFITSTIIAWIGWFFILTHIDPFAADAAWLLLFYVSMAIALFGTFSLLGFSFRVWFSKEERLFRHLAVASRQGGELAAFLVAFLLLQTSKYLAWWNIALLIILVMLIEFFSLSGKQTRV